MEKKIKRKHFGSEDEFRFDITHDYTMVEMFEVADFINPGDGIGWLREFQDEQEYFELVESLMERTGLKKEQLVVKDEAGTYASDGKRGVWYHEELAEAFVRWHQPEFAEDYIGTIKYLAEREAVLDVID